MTMQKMKPSQPSSIKGLYAITPDERNTAELLRKTSLVLQGGARVLQYRNKLAAAELQLVQATALRNLTREFGAILIVNDNALLAQKVAADGVHLGGEDGSIAAARAVLGSDKLIGVSCYNRLDLAHSAVQNGADYVAFGAFFASTVKPNAPVASLALLQQARREIVLPIVAIGGITMANGASLIAAGADSLAVISAVFAAADIKQSAQQFSELAAA
ncbi:MAG: thiamine-phosphate synthase [Pseudomonadota bacterium]|jgi:thiamine-phosphate pyrophosphorylase